MTSLSQLREAFLSYFEANGHLRKASAPLVPDNDPTLLFVNAGMVPFKNIFTGAETAFAPRATSSQKCVRAGGKHNDLDNVGYTARHHTFFEMLGNFSFGDYFKDDAIAFGWEFITRDLALPKDKLLVTVYGEDDEAAAIWKKVAGLGDDRIIRISTSDNFWSMGDTGPCGPCSEIFYDHGDDVPGGPPGSPDEDGDRFIEIWNLVFMQYDQIASGERQALPKPSIDTGMGLERVAAVLQGKHNNYETDLFQRLIEAEEEAYQTRAGDETIGSFRVIADHLRASAFLIADGVSPSNEGRGYVLRRIMRRAMRHSHILGARAPVMCKLVNTLVGEMGPAYPELGRAEAAITAELEQEEDRFQRTLGRGLAILEEASSNLRTGATLPGDIAFKLYDTFGFPLDLTQDILRSRDIGVDTAGFEAAMTLQKEGSRSAWAGSGQVHTDALWFDLRDLHGPSQFCGYDQEEAHSTLLAIVRDGAQSSTLTSGEGELLFGETPFYAESGGQAGDKGEIVFDSGARFIVSDVVKRAGDLHTHMGTLVSGSLEPGDRATLRIDQDRRRRIRANHSATHLMHAALRNLIGEHVTQKGSLVEEDKFRFDFSHKAPLSDAEIEAIEDQVNAVIRGNGVATTRQMPIDQAIAAGALALFGEKYDETVRVLAMGDDLATADQPYSVELCGGTHVARTGDIGAFVILSESGVSAGIRRIEAATGAEALAYLKGRAQVAVDLANTLKVPLKNLPDRISGLVDERRTLERDLSDAKRALAMGGGTSGPSHGPETIGDIKLIARVAQGVAAKDLRALVDDAKNQLGSGIAMFVGVNEGKAGVSIGVTPDLTERFSAVDLVRLASAALGGKGGGGRADMAQAGGPNGADAEQAIAAVKAAITEAA